MKRIGLAIGLMIVVSSLLIAACGAEAPDVAKNVTEIPLAKEETKEIPTLFPTLAPENSPTKDESEEKTGKGLGQKGCDNPFAPIPGDTKWVSGKAFLNVSEVEVKNNNEVSLKLAGDLPTPCHKLRVMISEADDEKMIHIEVYSVANPEEMCIQVLSPFEVKIPLGFYDEGEYTIVVNGEQIDLFQSR